MQNPKLKQWDRRFLLGLPLLLLLLYGLAAQYEAYQAGLLPVALPVEIEAVSGFDAAIAEDEVIIAIGGSVRNRGYYRLGEEVTLRQLLEFAGPLREADISQLDLAHSPVFGDEYYIASVEDAEPRPWLVNKADGEAGADGLLNINRASLEELTSLPSIGPSRAQAIIDYRLKHNGFSYKEELLGVKGIGEKIYEQLKDKIEV